MSLVTLDQRQKECAAVTITHLRRALKKLNLIGRPSEVREMRYRVELTIAELQDVAWPGVPCGGTSCAAQVRAKYGKRRPDKRAPWGKQE